MTKTDKPVSTLAIRLQSDIKIGTKVYSILLGEKLGRFVEDTLEAKLNTLDPNWRENLESGQFPDLDILKNTHGKVPTLKWGSKLKQFIKNLFSVKSQ